MLALIGNLGPLETVLIALVIVLVFGGRLPEVARQVFRFVAKARGTLDELRREMDLGGELRELKSDIQHELHHPTPPRTIEQKKTPDSDTESESKSAPDSTD